MHNEFFKIDIDKCDTPPGVYELSGKIEFDKSDVSPGFSKIFEGVEPQFEVRDGETGIKLGTAKIDLKTGDKIFTWVSKEEFDLQLEELKKMNEKLWLKITMVVLAVFTLVGCNYTEHHRGEVADVQVVEDIMPNGVSSTVIIDSCEYFKLEFYTSDSYTNYNLIHKGNCKNCRKFLSETKGVK